jgi:hypothetical protein
MPRYKLRTLLILTAIGPPMLAWGWPGLERLLWPRIPEPVVEYASGGSGPQWEPQIFTGPGGYEWPRKPAEPEP